MKLDFEQLRRLKESFHEQFQQDGEVSEQLNKGSMVYSLLLDPQDNSCSVHVQWPYFRNLVANEADCPATYSVNRSVVDGESWVHWTCKVLGITINACMYKSDVLYELKQLKMPAEESDIESLLVMWQNASGWNMEVTK